MNLTESEKLMLSLFGTEDYCGPIDGFCALTGERESAAGGVVSSLIKKGLARSIDFGDGEPALILTESGEKMAHK